MVSGRMKNGARALKNRSILVHPGFRNMKDKINREVKRRISAVRIAVLIEKARNGLL